jgi:hypothetical protein
MTITYVGLELFPTMCFGLSLRFVPREEFNFEDMFQVEIVVPFFVIRLNFHLDEENFQ